MRHTDRCLRFLAVALLLLVSLPVFARQTEKTEAAPLPAQTVLDTAFKQAKLSKKRVFVIFHASWCGWCKRLDAFMEKEANGKILKENYVIVHLTVQESKDKKNLENAGGETIMAKLGGEKSGLPFYAFLDEKGKKLADANVMPKNGNIGYPGSPEEIEAFGKLLKQTAPRLKPEQLASLVDYLKANAPKEH